MNDRPTLSLAMIVRDAERTLADALASAQPFVDEIVVVDTGSRDRTREIALQHGARLLEFSWCDDFSAARNHSLAHATGDWIVWLDADDVLPPQSGRELRARIDATPDRGAAFFALVEEEVHDKSGQSRVMVHAHVKLFPRHNQIHFRYRIHEQVAPAIRALGMPIHSTRIVVRHAHADRTPAAELARSQRNLRLALLDLQDHPDDPFVWMSVGSAYLHSKNGASLAVDYLARSAAAFPAGSNVQLNAYLYLGRAYAANGQDEQERATYVAALNKFPNDVSLLMRLGTWCESHGQPAEAIECYETALVSGKRRASSVQLRRPQVSMVLRLSNLYAGTGRPEAAQRLLTQFLVANPGAEPVRQALLALQMKSTSIIA
jgi:glycosyltransferase involved in cell wall biosynthesis